MLSFEALRAEEFAAYDEFEPRLKIIIDGGEFFLNFDETEGPLSVIDPVVNTDGDDRLFGDLGNDWLVGGTGQDNLYGGYGNDLMNADDNHETNGGLNDLPDGPQLSYEDTAFGGAGRDVLIANTGGDRLIDWAGEFNSYIVPFAPFGLGTVSRALAPSLMDYLYDLSEGDGADPTRAADTGAAVERNGEPEGELGLVKQQDADWQDQTGAPDDPQPGNIPGGARDVLRGADFNNGQPQGFFVDSGSFTTTGGRLEIAPEYLGGDAASVFHVGDPLPIYFEVAATVNGGKPIQGYKSNAYIIFDYQSEYDFKFAGVNISIDKLQMGHRTPEGWIVDEQTPSQLKPNKDYHLLLALNGTVATLVVDGTEVFSHVYDPRVDSTGYSYGLNLGMVGLGAENSIARVDNVGIQILPPEITYEDIEDFDDDVADIYTGGDTGDWEITAGRYEGTPVASEVLADSLTSLDIGANYLLRLDATLRTDAIGGVVFDRYADDDFKFAAISSVDDQVLIGHYTDRHGWTIDASFDKVINANKDYELTVTLKGSTVSVYLDDQALLGHVFNAVTVDGDFGLLSRDGTSKFDTVTVATNDPALTPEPETLLAASAPSAPAPADATVDAATLAAVVDAAIARWAASGLVSEADLAVLEDVTFGITDLDGLILGSTSGNRVLIDIDAAGFGWFIDSTLADDLEFDTDLGDGTLFATAGEAQGRMDLLTVVMHEIGHVFGFDHDDAEVAALMDDTLEAGTRALLPASDTAGVSGASAESEAVVATDDGAEPATPAVTDDSQTVAPTSGDDIAAGDTTASATTDSSSTTDDAGDTLTTDDTPTDPATVTDSDLPASPPSAPPAPASSEKVPSP